MRNMSFALTTEQVLNRTKTVTRRDGWRHLKVGDKIRAVRKCMGLKKGEKVEPLAELRILSVRREPLRRLTENLDYGFAECAAEGFGDDPVKRWPSEFISMFCGSHKGCTPDSEVTRIEFEYLTANAGNNRRESRRDERQVD